MSITILFLVKTSFGLWVHVCLCACMLWVHACIFTCIWYTCAGAWELECWHLYGLWELKVEVSKLYNQCFICIWYTCAGACVLECWHLYRLTMGIQTKLLKDVQSVLYAQSHFPIATSAVFSQHYILNCKKSSWSVLKLSSIVIFPPLIKTFYIFIIVI